MKRPGKITQLRISGMRVIEDLTLDLDGMTVLIGDNGTGKSTILEALEILRLATKPGSFIRDVIMSRHGGVDGLVRRGSDQMHLGCSVREPDGRAASFDFEIRRTQGWGVVIGEQFGDSENPSMDLPVSSPSGEVLNDRFEKLSLSSLTLPAIVRLRAILEHIDVQVPFETRPFWQQRELDLRESPRMPSVVETTSRLSRYGLNLANAFQELRNRGRETWQRVIDLTRLGLRSDVIDFRLPARRRGEVELEVVFAGDPENPMPVEFLSEGQLAYLLMIALCELSDGSSLLAFDEPELHFHPGLLARVIFMLEELSSSTPVLISTHSDRLLDCLSNPAASVVLCDLDERGATRLRRPNKEALDRWLETYRGVGSVRAEGAVEQLFDNSDEKRQ